MTMKSAPFQDASRISSETVCLPLYFIIYSNETSCDRFRRNNAVNV